ncbi:uncharacterized protein F4817DRAFT_326830 [Daldinia loculata]|uniref:uncharacterized protein n=1 Tax=Daldinia loculata TaxID=103429 RepID=UPI0020C2518D|nr:uncharacterized protein F4817DRAFT_326830 [Daldinia loculata]KAI1650629.1 hypothetical protein F4817DRAFT_326830 [Daldinia loculata]
MSLLYFFYLTFGKWCYIAKRNLDTAISLYRKTYPGGESDTFSIVWTPYYLNYNPHPYSVEKDTLVHVRRWMRGWTRMKGPTL